MRELQHILIPIPFIIIIPRHLLRSIFPIGMLMVHFRLVTVLGEQQMWGEMVE
jgi:hypothetical protein